MSAHALPRCEQGTGATHVAPWQCDEGGSTWCEIEPARTSVKPGAAVTCGRTDMCLNKCAWGRAHAASRRIAPRALRPPSHPLDPVSRTAGGISSYPLALGGRSLYSADMDASVAVREPSSDKGWRSVRSSLQLILVILVACAWATSADIVFEIAAERGLKLSLIHI